MATSHTTPPSRRKKLAYVADEANGILLGTGPDHASALADAKARAPIILACSTVIGGTGYARDLIAWRATGRRPE